MYRWLFHMGEIAKANRRTKISRIESKIRRVNTKGRQRANHTYARELYKTVLYNSRAVNAN